MLADLHAEDLRRQRIALHSLTMSTISAENLGKDYVLSHRDNDAPYRTLRDSMGGWFRKSKSTNYSAPRGSEIFHALHDVSFDVKQGEVLGIIGHNGAGKSTLLKILSRITEPTRGKVRLRGRVASLLEVGTGFHGELTGRENIFLNGAILGMSRTEIRAKFDEIVDFSGVEKFLDTPVKRYSSGMYVRLAFAVAAHLDPEILIVDEVLAVGDQEFQQKCLGKMRDISRGGHRTVLFVSHNMAAMRQLSSRCLYLLRGRVECLEETSLAIDRYTRASNRTEPQGCGTHSAILRTRLTNAEGMALDTCVGDETVFLETLVRSDGLPGLTLEGLLTDLCGTRIGFLSPGHFRGWTLPNHPGTYLCRLPITLPRLATGKYGFDIWTNIGGTTQDHYAVDAVVFDAATRLSFPAKWEMRKEYSAGFLVLESGPPTCTEHG